MAAKATGRCIAVSTPRVVVDAPSSASHGAPSDATSSPPQTATKLAAGRVDERASTHRRSEASSGGIAEEEITQPIGNDRRTPAKSAVRSCPAARQKNTMATLN